MTSESEPTRAAAADAPETAKGRVEVVPFSAIRRRIAQHMTLSQETAAQTLMAIEVDYQGVDAARKRAKAEGTPLSYLPFTARALVESVREFPRVNASVIERELHVYSRLNLGIAVDLDFEGLIVPVVKGACGKPLRTLALEIDDLATRARSRKLQPAEVGDGTFTITNAGGYGTLLTGAIINQPQVAILSTDGIRPKPVAVARGDGEYDVVVRPTGVLALTFDHRAFDGAYAAAFLRRLTTHLEERDLEAELSAP